MWTLLVLALPTIAFVAGNALLSRLARRRLVEDHLRRVLPEQAKPLNLRWGYTVGAARARWSALDAPMLALERLDLLLDLAFPLIYGAGFVAGAWILKSMAGDAIAPWIVCAAAATALADWVENLVLLGQLRRFVDSGPTALDAGWIRNASIATRAKLMLFIVAVILLLAGIVMA